MVTWFRPQWMHVTITYWWEQFWPSLTLRRRHRFCKNIHVCDCITQIFNVTSFKPNTVETVTRQILVINIETPYKTTNVMHWILFIRQILLLSSTCFEYQVLIFRRTWYSKHVEESNNIWRINNIQCITLVVLYGRFKSSLVPHSTNNKERNFVEPKAWQSRGWFVLTGEVWQADRQACVLLPIRRKQSWNAETMTII